MFAPAPWRFRALGAFAALLAAGPALAQKKNSAPPRIRIEIGACEHALWANMPGGMSSNVELANAGTTPECAALALGSTRQALTASSVLSAAARSTSFTVELLSKLNPWGLPADVAAKVLQAALESGGTLDGFKGQLGEQAMQQLANSLGGQAGGHGPSGTAAREKVVGEFAEQAFKYYRGSDFSETHTDTFHGMTCDGEFTVTVTASFLEARGEVRIVSSGDCHCAPFAGGVRVGAFAVVGVAPLTFGNLRKQGDEWVLSCTLGGPHYDVWAPCCQVRDDKWVSLRETPPPAAPVEVTPTAADKKRVADRENVSRRCDPDGRLSAQIFRLGMRFDWKRADGAPENVQRAAREELVRAQKPYCDCLNALRADPSLRGDAGLMEVLDEMRRLYCSPPAEVTPKPTPVPQAALPPCSAEREGYESARARWAGNPDNASATLSMVRMREGLCACLKQQHGGKLPPDLEAFCNPKTARTGAPAPVLTPASSPAVPTAVPGTAAGPPRFTAPPTCGSGEPVRIAGPFDGDAKNTRILVADRAAAVTEETAHDCLAQTPAGLAPGPVEILVTEGGRTTRLRSAALRLRMSADQLHLLRGQSTKFVVVVEGLNGIPESAWNGGPDPQFLNRAALDRAAPGTRIPGRSEPGHLLLTIENASRDTVTLAKSTNEVIRVEIRRGDVSPQGTYEYRGVIQSLQDGRFNVKGSVFALVAPSEGLAGAVTGAGRRGPVSSRPA